MVRNIGLPEIHGEVIGEKEVSLESLEEQITLQFKEIVLGPYPLIHGLMIFEMRQNQLHKLSRFNKNKL